MEDESDNSVHSEAPAVEASNAPMRRRLSDQYFSDDDYGVSCDL